jgi:hypothetical protein
MKNSVTLFMIIGVVLGSFTQSCNLFEKDEIQPDPKDINIFDVSMETEWDYWIVGKSGDYFFVKKENSQIKEIFFKPEQNKKGYPIFLNENGFPEKVVIEDYIFLFGNYNGNKFDISIISQNGDIEIVRDINTGIDWSLLSLKSAESAEDWRDDMKFLGKVAGTASCGISIAAGLATTGITLPLALVGCGATFVGILTETFPKDSEIMGLSATTVGTITAVIGCLQGAVVSCALDLASSATSILELGLRHLDENEENIRVAEAALYTGHGDIQITLTWDNDADLDLYVTEPNGNQIWWNEPSSSSGGILDYDDVDGFGPENIYWPKNSAPSGNYSVYIHHYVWEDEPSRPTSSNYTVLVSAFGRIAKYSGSIMLNESVHITEFNQNGIKSSSIGPKINISKKENKKEIPKNS